MNSVFHLCKDGFVILKVTYSFFKGFKKQIKLVCFADQNTYFDIFVNFLFTLMLWQPEGGWSEAESELRPSRQAEKEINKELQCYFTLPSAISPPSE